jgi:hypothetical protein
MMFHFTIKLHADGNITSKLIELECSLGDGGFYPSTQRHYRTLILLYYYTATRLIRCQLSNP